MLVSDVIAEVAFFLDYGTLVIVKFSSSAFLKAASNLEGQLARRLDYELHLGDYVILILGGTQVFMEETRRSPKETFVASVRRVARIIGPHRIRQLSHARPDLMSLEEVVRLAPGAKLVEQLNMCGKQE